MLRLSTRLKIRKLWTQLMREQPWDGNFSFSIPLITPSLSTRNTVWRASTTLKPNLSKMDRKPNLWILWLMPRIYIISLTQSWHRLDKLNSLPTMEILRFLPPSTLFKSRKLNLRSPNQNLRYSVKTTEYFWPTTARHSIPSSTSSPNSISNCSTSMKTPYPYGHHGP